MNRIHIPLIVTALFALSACASGPTLQERRAAAASAVAALQQTDFDRAHSEADTVLAADPKNPFAALVRALTGYKKAVHNLVLDMMGNVATVAMGRGLNARYLRFALENADKEFAAVDTDLAAAALEPAVDMELCIACWDYDWDHDGRVDSGDRRLLEIERGPDGDRLPEDAPERRPTYRYDYGDVLWARAFMAFQRAAINIVLGYDFERVAEELTGRGRIEQITLSPAYPEKLAAAKQLILQGLDFSDKSREAYLAETDDDREWLPNPRQKNHPMPLPVDDALYETWKNVVSDARKLVTGEEGLSLAEVSTLLEIDWEVQPKGYLNFGNFFDAPHTVVLTEELLEDIEDYGDENGALDRLLGNYRVMEMPASKLPLRATRMKQEVILGRESIEDKLRYLLWVN